MHDFIVALISFFLVTPLQQQVNDALAATRAPQEIVAAVATCARQHSQEIVDRAVNDPWWAASSVFKVWAGLSEPHALLVEAAPACAVAVEATRPFLSSGNDQAG